MRILLLNWQDWTHPLAGGAEVHLREIFRRIVKRGHSVDLLCSSYPGAQREEILDGVRIIRRGGRSTFNFSAAVAYRRELRRTAYDIVVEDVNKIPFYSTLYIPLPRLVIVPHLFGTTAFREVSWPLAAYVYAWELPMRRIYQRARFEAISESTREDLVGRGIPEDRIHVVYCGIDREEFGRCPDWIASDPPYILYLGRIKRYKRIELVLEAFKRVREREEDVRLVIAGEGDHRDALERRSREMGLDSAVSFTGHVSGREKVRLLQRAAIVMNTSEKEGWGLTNVEAQACGCPVVATDSPGIRESLRNERTGFLVPGRDVAALADRALRILGNPGLRMSFSEEASRWAGQFSWDRAVDQTLELIERVIAEHAG